MTYYLPLIYECIIPQASGDVSVSERLSGFESLFLNDPWDTTLVVDVRLILPASLFFFNKKRTYFKVYNMTILHIHIVK